MKKKILAVMVALVACCSAQQEARSQGKFGFGFVLGEPTGLAWSYRLSHENALAGALGFMPYERLRIHVDYLWHTYPFRTQDLSVHYGPGVAIGFGDRYYYNGRYRLFYEHEPGFGVRMAIGLTYAIPRAPLDAFFELAPMFVFTDDPGMVVDFGLGMRFYP